MRREIQDRYEYLESGLSNVVLKQIAAYVCECGERIIGLPNVERLHALICEKLLMKSSPLRGEELRFLRKSMGVKSVDFAKMLRVHAATLSKWESGDQAINEDHDKLIRFAVVLTISERAKREVMEAHRQVADQYLDLLGQINAIKPTEAERGETVVITEGDLDSVLTFRFGLTPAPDVELSV
jgi:DNA-binding transcriptional regulator YiaG